LARQSYRTHAADMSALLNELLDPKQVTLDLRAATRNEAILEIVETLRAAGGVKDYYALADAVMEREGRSSTNTGEGVAFPHARTDLVDGLVLGIGRSVAGVSFGGSTAPVHLIFLIGVPQRMVNDYLVCLGAIARLVKNQDTHKALMAAQTPAEFVELLRSGSLTVE
jgi:mannitol/fructose-specific phosphotransferase system IIA component (Ntr-type)